jgi:spoIIIJ-associated protein
MEWVETTAKTLEEAKDLALDRLGVAADEAEFEVLEEPRAGLFGRLRGEARVRARVMPTAVRPKQERRGRGRKERDGRGKDGQGRQRGKERASGVDDGADADDADDEGTLPEPSPSDDQQSAGSYGEAESAPKESAGTRRSKPSQSGRSTSKQQKEQQVNTQDAGESQVPPAEVGAAAEAFMSQLATAFGVVAETTVDIDGSDIDVRVTGSELGLMVGHGGRTLMAVQDLARVASQRRLGDQDTRLRIDIGGYREKRSEALSQFAVAVATQVVESGTPKALEPMQSADRKVVHDALASVEGVTSRSEGDDPMRRVVISPA